jgi:plasmid stabilization system protein ParE
MSPPFWITPTALNHVRKAIKDTRDKWGHRQAIKYRQSLEKGFYHIAQNHLSFHSPHRDELAEGTPFSLHLVEHHYVVFQKQGDNVVIAGLFHETMDIPSRLKALETMSRHEIERIKAIIALEKKP